VNDKADTRSIWNVPTSRFLGNSIVDHPYLYPIDKPEQSPVRRMSRALSTVVTDKRKQFRFIHMVMNHPNKCAADVPLCSFDVDTKSRTAYKRDPLLCKMWLQPIEIVTDRAVRYVQETRKSKKLERFICHEKARRKDGAPLIGGKFPVCVSVRGEMFAQTPEILRIAREHKPRARAPQQRNSIRHQSHLESMQLTRNSA
jgi:hypothetical protein